MSDGSTLTIHRSVEFERQGQIGSGTAWVPLEESLSFRDPASGADIRWEGSRRIAAVVDRVDGRLWVVGLLTTNCRAGYVGQPRWVAFALDGREWRPTDADHTPPFSEPNLLLDSYDYGLTSSLRHVSLNSKAAMNASSSRSDLYRRIDFSLLARC